MNRSKVSNDDQRSVDFHEIDLFKDPKTKEINKLEFQLAIVDSAIQKVLKNDHVDLENVSHIKAETTGEIY